MRRRLVGVDRAEVWRWASDVVIAGIAAYTAVILTLEWMRDVGQQPRAIAVGLAFTHGAVLVVRRRLPATVLAVVIVTSLAYAALGAPVFFLGPASLVAVYTLAAVDDRRRSLIGVGVAEAALAVGAVTGGVQWDSWLLYSLLLATAWLLGAGLQRWQQTAREQADRADQLAQAREELARLAVTQERVRIARELHDMVAHSMSVIAVQAATGRLVIDSDPASAREALAAIEVATRSALDEMRQLLAVLRDDDSTAGQRDPTPGLGDLHALVARMARAGLTVEVDVAGDPGEVPAGVSLACYRIIQEGLTNVLRHAGPTHVSVTANCAGDAVDVEVRDRGTATTGQSGVGQGTVGMRERAAMYGGTFSSGPDPGGGWVVRARLPYEQRPPAVTA